MRMPSSILVKKPGLTEKGNSQPISTTQQTFSELLPWAVHSSSLLLPLIAILMLYLGTSNKDLDALISFNPRTKDDFEKLSHNIIEFIVKRHQDKPLYAAFVEHHVRELAMPLRDVEVRKAASGLTTLANEKQKEQRDKASGKKKPKATTKPALGASKVSNK